MSFNHSQPVPSFTTNRAQEDTFWKQKSAGRAQEDSFFGKSNNTNGSVSSYSYARSNHGSISHGFGGAAEGSHTRKPSIVDKIGGMINPQSEADLPLYKDKPRFPSGNRKGIWSIVFPRGKRKRWGILCVLALIVLWYLGLFSSSSPVPSVGDEWAENSGVWAWWTKEEIDWKARRDIVQKTFVISWDAYAKNAWGMDNYSPVSRKGSMIVKGESSTAGMGWIIVDALDTAMIMNLTDKVTQARGWIKTSLDFSQANEAVPVFEATSKILGGLLSAYYLSTTFPSLAALSDDDSGMKGEDLYIEKAVDLVDRLLGAFDTPSGIPMSSVNLNTSTGILGTDHDGASLTAEVAGLQLELKYISKITGEPLYWERAERIMKVIDAPRPTGGLVPTCIDPSTASSKHPGVSLGSTGTTYYDYLVKQFLQTGSRETIYNTMWEEALTGMKTYMLSFSKNGNFTVVGERPQGLAEAFSNKMDHSTCSLPAIIALGVTGGQTVKEAKKRLGKSWGQKQEENLLLAEELLKTCWAMHAVTPTMLAPESVHMELDSPPPYYQSSIVPASSVEFSKSDPRTLPSLPTWKSDFTIQESESSNQQSPHTIKSLYYLYRITQHPKYRHWGWQLFQSFTEYTRVTDEYGKPAGYTSLESVLRDPALDKSSRKSSVTGVNSKMVGDRHVDDNTVKEDHLNPVWMAETLKYFYLLFSDDPLSATHRKHPSPLSSGTNVIGDEWFDLSKTVINSEGHIFPRFDIEGSQVWKTGWTRSERTVVEMQKDEGEGGSRKRDADGGADAEKKAEEVKAREEQQAKEAAEGLEKWNMANNGLEEKRDLNLNLNFGHVMMG